MTLKRRIADLEFALMRRSPEAEEEEGPPYALDDLVKLFECSVSNDPSAMAEYNRIVESYKGMELVTIEKWAGMRGLSIQ